MLGGALCNEVTSLRKLESVEEAGTEEVRASCSETENKQNDPPERRKGRGASTIWKIGSLIPLPHGVSNPLALEASCIYICHIRSYANIRQPLCRGIHTSLRAVRDRVFVYPSDLQGNLKQPNRDRLVWARKSFGVKPRLTQDPKLPE
jgi:hypothetical protein